MPNLRKKVAGFIRQLSISNLAEAIENIGHGEQPMQSPQILSQDFPGNSFITRYLNGLEKKQEDPPILYGRNPEELPSKQLDKFEKTEEIFAACTGPDRGLTAINLQQKHLNISGTNNDYIDTLDQNEQRGSKSTSSVIIAGVADWFNPHEKAYGIATTLYEKNPTSNTNNGEPIADCFGIIARPNSAILALADGVNWGLKASIAARSAVHGSIEYLNRVLFCSSISNEPITTKDVFVALLRSFHAAHSLILQEQGMLTTLTVCTILPLPSSNTTDINICHRKYIACTCNVGDSLAYVYSKKNGVREITRGSHDIHCMRDMRDALGALGPVDGCNPELNNLTLAITEVEKDDIVFLTSDGISDNFDPVVGKFAVLPNPSGSADSATLKNHDAKMKMRRKSIENIRHTGSNNSNENCNNLPVVEAYQRHELTLLRMEDLLRRGVSGEGPPCNSAKHLCELLLDFVVCITAAKRRILEDTELYYEQHENGQLIQLSKQEQRSRRKKTLDKISMIPGKLDHATVVAYVVGS